MYEQKKEQIDSVVTFGPYRLDLTNTQLWRGTQEVKLTPKALAALCYFIGHPRQLVSKGDLFHAVWPQTVVSDATLASCIQELRQALRDDAKKPRYLETVHRRGYRFIAPITSTSQPVSSFKFQVSSPQSPPAPHPQHPAPTLVERLSEPSWSSPASTATDKPAIAVLPFVNMSSDPEQEYFSDGITETLITDLARLPNLLVTSRHSTFTYKGKAVTVPEVSKDLGVQYVLEGGVQKIGDRVRISAQLIDALQDQHLWSERYDRPLTDIFALQDEIVQRIVMTLGLQFTLVEQGTCLKVRQATNNVEAYETLLRAASDYMRFTQETNLRARQLAEKAITLDPQYAEAYALQAWTYWAEWSHQWSQDAQVVEQAFALAQRARTLNDSVPSAHMLLGYIYLWKNQPEQAVAAGERAIAVSPTDDASYAVLGAILLNIGRPEEALGLVETALRLNPHSYYEIFLGEAYRLTGRSEEAIVAQNRVLARNPNLSLAHLQLAALYSELGREEEARAAAAQVLRLSPNFSLEGWRQSSLQKDQTTLERTLAALRKAGLT